MAGYDVVIGLEVHVQLATKTKIFCSCPVRFGDRENINTCPVCLGLPGSLPVLNKEALRLGIKAGLAINASIASRLKFDRKNYFYPDLPKAYQISQYDMPLAYGGHIKIETDNGEKLIGITRAHLEEDAGKLVHEGLIDISHVDYNRTGTPLLEIVSEPDMASPEEAYKYLVNLKQIMLYAEVSDCNMEEGSLRCDANISLKPNGSEKLGTKVEIKNLNSFKAVEKALKYEIERQGDLLDDGEPVIQETRLWNEAKGVTVSMRSKEEAHDYRYFPDPDLVSFTIAESLIDEIGKSLPELPREKRERFKKEYGLSSYDIGVLTQERSIADFFEEVVKNGVNPKSVSNWIQGEVLAILNYRSIKWENLNLTPKQLSELILMVDSGKINGKTGKAVLYDVVETGKDPAVIVEEKGLAQVSDESYLNEVIGKVISENGKSVADYRSGKKNALGFLMGQVMKATKGKANPQLASKMLRDKLN